MKKKILIFSAGSAGREVNQLISSINKISENWEVVGYVDNDKNKVGKTIDGLNVYSNSNKPHNKDIYAICGIMDGSLRKKIFSEEIIKNDYKLTNLIHPSVEQPKSLKIGLGNIIFGNVHISFEVNINNFSLISNFCDLGHNLITNNYFTIMPSVIIGGSCEIGEQTSRKTGKSNQDSAFGMCVKCGSAISAEDLFCTSCGAKR